MDRLDDLIRWIRKGCPCCRCSMGLGDRRKLDFHAVLRWRKDDLAQQWRQWISSDESIKRIAEMEATVRQRLKALKPRRRVCK